MKDLNQHHGKPSKKDGLPERKLQKSSKPSTPQASPPLANLTSPPVPKPVEPIAGSPKTRRKNEMHREIDNKNQAVESTPDATNPPERVPDLQPLASDSNWPRVKPSLLDESGREVTKWIEPPLSPDDKGDVSEVSEMIGHLRDKGHLPQALSLQARLKSALDAGKQYQKARELAAFALNDTNVRAAEDNARLEEPLRVAREKVEQKRTAWQDCSEKAARTCAEADLTSNAREAREALKSQIPSGEEILGADGCLHFKPRRMHPWAEMSYLFVEGFVLMVLALGRLLELFRPGDLGDWSIAPRLLFATLIGAAMVFVMGWAITTAVIPLARQMLDRAPGRPPHELAPKLRRLVWIVSWSGVMVIVVAVLAVSATGVHLSGLQAASDVAKWNDASTRGALTSQMDAMSALPWWLCMAIAAISTIPYLFYKGNLASEEVQHAAREQWVAHRQRDWLTHRLAEVRVIRADFTLRRTAQAVDAVAKAEGEVKALEGKRQPMRDRFDDETALLLEMARETACGEAAQLRRKVNDFASLLDPIEGPSDFTLWQPSRAERPNFDDLIAIPVSIFHSV